MAHPQHARNGEAPDVRIDHTHGVTGPGEGDRQVRGDGRLPDTTLAGGHRHDAGS